MAEKIGLIAGNGRFPFLVLDAARSLGHPVVIIAIKEEADKDLEDAASRTGSPIHFVSIGQLGTFLKILKDEQITQAVMAGQVKHVKIFGGFVPDLTALSLIGKLKAMNTDSLIGAVAELMRERGVELVNSATFLEPMLAGEGQLSDRVPGEAEHKDLQFGYRMADTIAGLDIGQTIAVKHQAVVAVEAMEGTDETIARAGHLAGDGVTIIKVAKPNQDMRFDVPIVGLATVQAMRLAGAKCLSVDAGRTLIFDREAFLASANEAGIAVVGRPRTQQSLPTTDQDHHR
ncbi:MAG TPA: UDP-2,3-diacylglucosamine diphosphatase LpxI [Vicinamibacterales bacterium]|nr:UDP-2,3-diacylglucosamine diphosphatase LpxI [Vicinamibacterales bacterium]